jgi:lysophospholipase L1-like esterase
MQSVKSWVIGAALAVMLALSAACSPTAPTPPPPPPPPPAPLLSCGEGVSRATVNAGGLTVSFDAPSATGGQSPVNVTCSPSSGENFPIGTTAVTCKATDALNRTAECAFPVTVAKLAQLSKVRYLAFGDSVTSGEVSFPIGSTSFHGLGGITKQVVVPSAAYPTILAKTLQGRYASQSEQIVVANYGLGGEKTIFARDRFFQALSIVRPEAVLLMEGYNDIPGGLDGAASGAASEIDIMAAEARRRGMIVFLATLLPPRPGGNRSIDPIYVIDYNNRMRVVASRQGAVLVDLYAALLPEVNRYIGVDGLHPNEAGYARIADIFFQAIQANLEVR